MSVKLLMHHLILKWSRQLMGSVAIDFPEEIQTCSGISMAWLGGVIVPYSVLSAQDARFWSVMIQSIFTTQRTLCWRKSVKALRRIEGLWWTEAVWTQESCARSLLWVALCSSPHVWLNFTTQPWGYWIWRAIIFNSVDHLPYMSSLSLYSHPVNILFPASCIRYIISKIWKLLCVLYSVII